MLQTGHSQRGVLCLALLTGCAGADRPTEAFPEPVVLEISRGATSQEIAEMLESRGVISSKWAFLWERVWNREATLMAGEYLFEQPVRADEAFEILASGRVQLYPITIPEGYNRFEIADLVAEAGLGTRSEFLQLTVDPTRIREFLPLAETLEGCLFPETYNLAKTSSVEDLVDAMVARFLQVMEAVRLQQTAPLEDWQALILASMIEKETESEDERGLVSSVFHNRMRLGMLMQCDPTIIYGLILEGRYRGRIYLTDLRDAHPYNTYVHGGLPPGPITNPGKQSLLAAFCPAESDYLFFVAKPGFESGHVFSKSLRDHNRAVRDLRRFERSR